MLEKVKKYIIGNDRFFLILSGLLLSLFVLIPWAEAKFPFHYTRGETLTQWIPFRLFMLHNYQEGIFPFDRLEKFYDFSEINQAIADSRSGETIKPVLRISQQ